MAAPALLQTSSLATGNGTATVSLTGVTAGSTIVLLITQGSAATRTYSATSYSSAVQNNSSRAAAILYRTNVSAGSHSITVNANTGTVAISVLAIEIGPSRFENSAQVTDSVSVNSHPCAPSGSIDSAADSFLVSGGVLNASGTTLTKHSTATLLYSDTVILWQYERADAGFVDEAHDWNSSTARIATCVSATFVAVSTGATATVNATDGADTLTATATVLVQGTSSGTDGADALVASATVAIDGASTQTDGADTLTATATVLVQGTSSGTDGADTLVATATASGGITGTVSAIDGADALVASATVAVVGVSSGIDGPDNLTATVVVGVAAGSDYVVPLFLSDFSTLGS